MFFFLWWPVTVLNVSRVCFNHVITLCGSPWRQLHFLHWMKNKTDCDSWEMKVTDHHTNWFNHYCHIHSTLQHISIKTRHTSFQWCIIHLHISPYLFKKVIKRQKSVFSTISASKLKHSQEWLEFKNYSRIFITDLLREDTFFSCSPPLHRL